MSLAKALKTAFSRRDAYLYHASWARLMRKPGLVARLVRLYATYLLTSKSPLRLLDMAITASCQYRCPHCYPDRFYEDGRTPMSVEDMGRIMARARELGVVQFNFQGGEPTLDLDRLEAIVALAEPPRSYISLSSNGYRHKLEDLQRIRSMGVDKIAYSLHSGIPAEHDAFVGSEGAYHRVLTCLDNAPRAGLEATLAMVVSRENIRSEGVAKVMELCIKREIILDVNIGAPVGRWMGDEDVLLSEADFRWLDEVNRKHPNIRRDLHPHLFRTGCLAAKEILYVNVFGEVLTCPFLHFSLGNARTADLKQMRDTALANPWFATHHPKCLAAEDPEFFRKHMSQVFQAKSVPVPWSETLGK